MIEKAFSRQNTQSLVRLNYPSWNSSTRLRELSPYAYTLLEHVRLPTSAALKLYIMQKLDNLNVKLIDLLLGQCHWMGDRHSQWR